MADRPESGTDRLTSWKEIAAYLGKGVRTAERWERELGLPVHRLEGKKRDIVHALPKELDAWLEEHSHQIESNNKSVQPTGFPRQDGASRPWAATLRSPAAEAAGLNKMLYFGLAVIAAIACSGADGMAGGG